MAKIDIDSLDEAALMELHDQIVDRLHFLHRGVGASINDRRDCRL